MKPGFYSESVSTACAFPIMSVTPRRFFFCCQTPPSSEEMLVVEASLSGSRSSVNEWAGKDNEGWIKITGSLVWPASTWKTGIWNVTTYPSHKYTPLSKTVVFKIWSHPTRWLGPSLITLIIKRSRPYKESLLRAIQKVMNWLRRQEIQAKVGDPISLKSPTLSTSPSSLPRGPCNLYVVC